MKLTASDRHALKKVLQGRRDAIDPATVGIPQRVRGRGRRAAGLSQEQVDVLLERTPGTYNRFENGQLAKPGGEFLTAVAKVLRLSEPEWVFLWQLTRKENPPHTLHASAGMSIAGVWQRVVDQVGGALAYVSDAEWNVVVHNEEFRRLFPRGKAPTNIMRFLLLDPRARTETLTDWESLWAPTMMPHLKQSVELRRSRPELARLEHDVLDDPVAGPLYRDCASVPVPYYDGSELPINHAVHGPGLLTTCLAQPITAPGARMNLSFYTPIDAQGSDLPSLNTQ